METLLLDPSFPIAMAPCAPVLKNEVGAAAAEFRRKWPIPYYEFTISLPYDEQEVAEALMSFAVYHQGDTAFMFDGGHWGNIESPVLIALQNGSDTQFYLPRRNVMGPSWVLYANEGVVTNWTVIEQTGLVTFGSAPAAGRLSGKGPNKFKCVLSFDDRKMYEPEEAYSKIYNDGKIMFREIP